MINVDSIWDSFSITDYHCLPIECRSYFFRKERYFKEKKLILKVFQIISMTNSSLESASMIKPGKIILNASLSKDIEFG